MVKNTLRLGLIALLLIIPTGTPDDLILVPAVIKAIGLEAYIILAVIISVSLYNSTRGKTLADKLKVVKKELAGGG